METTKRELINNSQLLRIPISAHLRDHKIGGRVVLSAASLLSVIFDRRSNDRQIGDVVFLKRVFVDDHNVCLKYIEKTEGIEIVDSENSLVFAAAEIRNDKKLKNVQTELLNNFESNEKAELVMHDHFYDFMHQTGYEHSGDFTAVHWLELKEENGIASGTVVMCPSTHLDSQLDGLWQSMVYAAMKREDTTVKLLVPFSLEAIEWQKNEDRRLNHRFASTGRFVLNLKEKRGDFILYDSRTDRILVTGTGISFRSVEINKSQPPTSVQKKIGIRAMSCRLPGGVRSAEDFWRLLSGGKTTDQRIPSARLADRNSLIRGQRYAHQLEGGNFIDGGGQSEEVNEIAGFDCRLFGWSANEAKAADPQQRLVMRCAYECVEKAGLLTSDHRQLRRMGVFVGQMGSAEYADMHSQSEDNGNPNNDALLMLGAQPSVMSGRLSHFFDARGESIVIDSACSSSLVAMNLACSALSNGQIDFALVAGVNVILSTRAMGQRANGQLLAADGRCKSFDSRADGYGRADGCVVMVLERAVEGRQYEAMIDAITVNHDGRSVALTAPNGEAQCELISECLKQTRGSTLVAWECHGTGTSLGDPIEIKALQKAISNSVDDHNLKLGSEVWLSTAKATIGHTEAAAGLVGVMKAVLQLQNQSVPMLPDFRSLNPQIQLKSRFKFPINNPVNLKVDSQSICGVSAFGVGGTNACAVISRSCPLIDDEEVDELPRLIPVSAKSEHSLQLLIQKTSELLNSKNWSLISAAAALYRRHYEQRAVILKSGVLERLKFAEKPKVQIKIQQTDQSTDFWKVIPRLSQTKGTQLTTTVQWLLNVGFETEDFDLRNPLISASINGKSMDTRKDEHFVFNFCFNSSPPLTLATRSPEDVEKAIGYLYASMGREVKWTKLFDRMVDSERVLSAVKLLPSYQFDLSRFWRSEANFGAREFDHPLIGNPIDYKGQVAGKFEGHVSYRRLATFFEHSGDFFTFGSAVEIASSIVVFCLPNRRLRIGKFEFDSAVPLTDDSWIGAEFSVSEQKECKIRFGVLMNTEIERVICELTAAVGEEETEEINSNAQLLPESMDQPKDFVTDGERRSSEFTETVIKLDFLIRLFNQNAVQIRLLTSRKLTRIARYSLNNKEVRCFDQSGNLLVILSSRIELKETESLLKERKEATAIPPSNLLANQQPSIDDLKNKIARLLQSSISDGMPLTNDHYDRGFFDLGADSLALVGFANELGRSGLPRITTSDLLANPTINSLASFIESKITLTTPTETLNLITEMPKESKEKKLRFAHIYETKLSTVSLPVKEEVEVGTPRTDEEEENATEALLYAVERCQLPTTPTTPRSTNFAALRSMRVRILLKPTALTQTTTAKGDLERETHVYIRHGRQRHNVTFAALARRLGGASAVEFTFGAPPLRFDAIEKEAATFNTAAISRLFVRLGRTLLDVRRPAADAANPMELSVRMEKTWQSEAENTNVGWLSAMAVAFLKSFCAENPTQFAFKFTERLRPLTEVKLEEREEEEEEFLITPEIEDTKEIPSCWLITGGTSGIGWLMARHLSLKPTTRRVYLIGRRWPATEIANEIAAINSTSEEKRIEIKLADVCDRERLCELAIEIADWLQKTGESLGFIHSAGCVDDRLLSAQNVERFGRVLDPKCRGLMNLQFALNCAAIRPLLCVYNSSVSSVLGNTGQSNYAAANALLDYLAETSEKSISINWANWLEAGFAANDTVRGLLRRKGFYGLRTVEALRAFDWAVDHANCCSQVFVARADWRRMFEFRPELRSVIQQPFSENFDNMKRQVSEEEEVKMQLTASDSKLPIQIYDKNPEKLESLSEISDHTEDLSLSTSQEDSISINSKKDLRELLVAELSDLLHSSENLDPAAGFMELGVDSFGMFSLANTMNRRIGRPILNVIHLFEHSTINKLTEYLAAEMEKENVQENSNKNVPDRPKISIAESEDNMGSQRTVEFVVDPIELEVKTAGGVQDHHPLELAQDCKQTNEENNEKKKEEIEQEEPRDPTSSQFVAKAETKSQPMKRPNLIFLFAGHGSLYPKACSQLSREVPYIATQIRACSEAFETHLPTRMSIEKLLLEPDSSVASKSTRKQKERNRLPLAVEHAAIFTVGYSLARFWRHVGLEPTHLIGHSLGELIAVCIAGFLSLSDAAELVCLRATALEKHRGKGSMLALDADFARSHAADFGLQTAAVNGPRQIVLCGSQKNVTKAKAIAEQKREAATIVSDEYAFHSDKFVKSDHLKVLHRFDWSKIKPTSESPILISNLTAKPLEHYDRQYLKRHAQSTVEFWSCVETVLAEGEATFVEVTAGRVLTSLVQKILNSRQLRYLVVPTVHAGEPNELDTLKWTAQKLQLKGHPVDERAFGRAVGEDFVERAASAFTSSFRLAKSGSLNTGRHHLVAWPPRPKATDCKRGVSVRVQTVTQKPLSQESKTIDSIGTQLILHQRPVEIKELDIEIANEHQLFGIPIAPAAFQLKSLGAHLRLAEITMHDVRFAQKLHADELRTLETVYRDGRLQLKRSTADIGVSIVAQQHSSGQKMSTGGLAATLFSSCIVDVPEAPARRVSIHPPADLPAISSIRLQTGGTATSVPLELNSYVEVPAPPNSVAPQQKDAPDFPDSDPGIYLSPSKFYDGMAAHGFAYGARLRLLTDIRLIGTAKIRARARKPSAPWVLYDAALQTLSAGLYDSRLSCCYVPVGVDEVWSRFPTAEEFTKDVEGQFTLHAELTRRAGDLVEGSVWIFARGVLIGYLKNVRAIKATAWTMRAETNARQKHQKKHNDGDSMDDNRWASDGETRDPKRGGKSKKFGNSDSKTVNHASRSAANEYDGARRFSAPSTVQRIATAVHAFKRTRPDFWERPKRNVKLKTVELHEEVRTANVGLQTNEQPVIVLRSLYGQFATDDQNLPQIFAPFAQLSTNSEVFRLAQSAADFDCEHFGLTPREAKWMDPQQRRLLEATDLCLRANGLKEAPENCGVFVGCSSSDFAQKAFASDKTDGYLMAGTNGSSLASRIAYQFGARGPSLTLDSACSSFHSAVCVAAEFLRSGRCKFALVGAVGLALNDQTTEVIRKAGVLSPNHRCATFDSEADGFVRSEGYSMVLFEAVERRKLTDRSIVLSGWSLRHSGGRSAGFCAPSVEAETEVMIEAADGQKVDLIESHGTGTKLGDPMEVEAIGRFVNTTLQSQLTIHASKPRFGHSEAAAGANSFFCAVTMMKNAKIPPIRNFRSPNPRCRFPLNVLIPKNELRRPLKRVLVNAFGFTGTVSSLCLEMHGELGKQIDLQLPTADFRPQRLWPFDEKEPEFFASKCDFEFFASNRSFSTLIDESDVILKCGQTSHSNAINIMNAKTNDLDVRRILLLVNLTDDPKILASECAAMCHFFSEIPSRLQLNCVITSKKNFRTANALLRSCLLERQITQTTIFALSDSLQEFKWIFSPAVSVPVQPISSLLIIGGCGGIARELLQRLKPKFALIVGRSTKPNNSNWPSNWMYSQTNVSDLELLDRLLRSMPRFEMVINAAGVVENSLLSNQTVDKFSRVFESKVVGTRNLLSLCEKYEINRFVALSSTAALDGSFGQSNYSAANAQMSELIERSQVNFTEFVLGPVEDVGMLSGSERKEIRKQIEENGIWLLLKSSKVVAEMERLIRTPGRFLIAKQRARETHKEDKQQVEVIVEKKNLQVTNQLRVMIENIAGLTAVAPRRGFMSLGLDSLMIEKLRQETQKQFGISIAAAEMFENANLESLTALIGRKRRSHESPPRNFGPKRRSSSIVISGFSGRFPKSANLNGFFDLLCDGRELLSYSEARENFVSASSCLDWTGEHFDYEFFGLSVEEAKQIDPQTQILIHEAYGCLEASGLCERRRNGMRIATFASTEPIEHPTTTKQPEGSLIGMYERNRKDFAALWLSNLLELKGPAVQVYTACSSGLAGLSQGVAFLRSDAQIDGCLICAAHLVQQPGHDIEAGSPLATEAHSRPLSQDATGILRGSAAGVFLLRREEDAKRDGDRILARIVAIETNNDANRQKSNFMAPSACGQQEVVERALRSADVRRLDFVECHATGTRIGDQIELRALERAFAAVGIQNRPFLGSVKANVGHAFAAASIVSVGKCLKILDTKKVPPQINVENPVEEINRFAEINTTVTRLRESPLRLMTNSFGIGGTNGCLILEEAEQEPTGTVDKSIDSMVSGLFLLPISAKSSVGCLNKCKKLSEYLRANKETDLSVLSNTLVNYRDHFDHRIAFWVEDVNDAIRKLEDANKKKIEITKTNRKFAFFFGHQGPQVDGILSSDRQFCPSIERTDSLLDLFHAVLQFYAKLKIPNPTVVFGHSYGEFGAFLAADAFDFDSLRRFVDKRQRLCARTQDARMFAIRGAENQLPEELELTAILNDDLRAFACSFRDKTKVEGILKTQKREYVELPTTSGFHSTRFMSPILKDFRLLAQRFLYAQKRRELKSPIISNVNGRVIEEAEEITATHLITHLTCPVRLDLTVETLRREFPDVNLVIEIGPSGVLKSVLNSRVYRRIPTTSQYQRPQLLNSIAQLWMLGIDVDLKQLVGETKKRIFDLPLCNFDVPTFEDNRLRTFEQIWRFHCNLNVDTKLNGNVHWIHEDDKTKNLKSLWGERESWNENEKIAIVYIQSEVPRKSTFFDLLELKSFLENCSNAQLFVLSPESNPMATIGLGIIDELRNATHVLVDAKEHLVATVGNLQEVDDVEVRRFRLNGTILMRLDYVERRTEELETQKETFLLIGGNGDLGRELTKKLDGNLIVIARQLISDSHAKQFQADVTRLEELRRALKEVGRQFPKIDCTIFLVGRPPSNNSDVLNCKVDGFSNLIRAADVLNFSLGSVVLCSSLSAVSRLPGIEFYVSANCFLDHQTSMAMDVVSLQLPPLKHTRMMSAEKDEGFLTQNAVDLNAAADWILKMRRKKGTFAFCSVNPMELRSFVRRPTHADRSLQQIWTNSLATSSSHVNEADDFYSMGGSSLSALQLVWRVEELFNVKMSVEELRANSTFGRLSRFIEEKKMDRKRAVKTESAQLISAPLSLAQEQMWILFKLHPLAYNIVFLLKFRGRFDADAAKFALWRTIERQKILRVFFEEREGKVEQKLMSVQTAFDRTFLSADDVDLNDLIERERNFHFDLNFSTFRFILRRDDSTTHVLINQQHIITDGWSISVFAHDFCAFYQKRELAPLRFEYFDFAVETQKNFDAQKCRQFAAFLSELPPSGSSLWPQKNTETTRSVKMEIDATLIAELNRLSAQFGVTRFLLTLTAFLRALNRWRRPASGDPLVFGVPTAGRKGKETAELIGYFLNNLVVSIRPEDGLYAESLKETLRFVDEAVSRAQHFSDVYFHRAVAEMRRFEDQQPVFQVFFNYRHQLDFPTVSLGPDLSCEVEQLTNNNVFQLSISVDELDAQRMLINFDFSDQLSQRQVSSFGDDFREFLWNLDKSGEPTSEEFIYEVEDEKAVKFMSVIHNFAQQSRAQPLKTAISFPDGAILNYKTLWQRVCRKSKFLFDSCPDLNMQTIFMIRLDRNQSVEWILAVLALGCPFCPMDPHEPLGRQTEMLKQLRSSILISDGPFEHSNTTINIADEPRGCDSSVNFQIPWIQPQSLAYVIFTSGSTGSPKPVAIEHQQLANFVRRAKKEFKVDANSQIGHSVNTIFDVSVFNIFASLTSGAELQFETQILDFLNSEVRLTHLFLTTAIFNSLPTEKLSKLSKLTKRLIVGGDTPSTSKLRTVIENGGVVSQIYGPTETTVWVAVKHFDNDEHPDGQNIGRLTQRFFLTAPGDSRPLKKGSMAVGELWICGDQVARGYLNQQSDRFVEKSFSGCGRVYRTGDLIRLRENKNEFEFLGRQDDQLKLRGVRSNRTEICQQIQRLLDPNDHVEIAVQQQDLIVYVVTDYNELELRNKFATHLPNFMVPNKIVLLPNGLPINSNGKIDHRGLLKLTATSNEPFASSKNSETRQRLIEVWRNLLPDFTANDGEENFFRLGGHSLLLIQLQSQIECIFSVSLRFDQLYCAVNLSDQIALIDSQLTAEAFQVVQTILELKSAHASAYLIHAIGGTVFSFFSFSQFWPSNCNLYAIGYDSRYPAESLSELAQFYNKQIQIHSKKKKLPFLLFGHSMGGILAWEIAVQIERTTRTSPTVCAFDSWVVDNHKLNENEILKYLESRFSALENSEELIRSAMRLSRMLKNHRMEANSRVPLVLFKANRLGESALRHVIRKDLNDQMITRKVDNGWSVFVDDLTVHRCTGDHDSMLEPRNLRQKVSILKQLIQETIHSASSRLQNKRI